jgi:DNA-directed RNA polymerase subunit RPC12/RpoP
VRIEELIQRAMSQPVDPGYKAYADCAECGRQHQRLDDVGAAEVSGDTEYFCTGCGATLVEVRSVGGGEYSLDVRGGVQLEVPPESS